MGLDKIQEIERAIDALTPKQLEELFVWLDQNYPQAIDAQLKTDLEGNGGQPDPRDLFALRLEENRADQAVLHPPIPPISDRLSGCPPLFRDLLVLAGQFRGQTGLPLSRNARPWNSRVDNQVTDGTFERFRFPRIAG